MYIYILIPCEICAANKLLLNLTQYCILSRDTINGHNIFASIMGAVFLPSPQKKGLYLSLGKMKSAHRNNTYSEKSHIKT